MATFYGTFINVVNMTARGGELPVGAGKGALGLADLTTSGTAATAQRGGSDWTAPSAGYLVCFADGDVRVATGETAAAGASGVGHFVPASTVYAISIAAGDSVSVIDA